MTAVVSPNVAVILPVSGIVFREDLYPRIETSAVKVQEYAEDLAVLPPIEVNQRNELIDGWHRWTAHRKVGADTILGIVTRTDSDADLLELAIERNAKHGLQLSMLDKQRMAVRIYGMHVYSSQKEREEKKDHLATILSVGGRTVRRWLDRTDKDVKAELKQKAFDMWLACHSHEDISEAIGYSRRAVSDLLDKIGDLGANGQLAASAQADENGEETDDDRGLGKLSFTKEQVANSEHATDFEAPIYNVWKQQNKTAGSTHFGNSEIRWVDNLLYLYTAPFDTVVDPFAGGGSTIDLCRKRLRRYWVSDRLPVVEREKDIRKLDVTEEMPSVRWKDVGLVYLDPPYWKQAEGEYSTDTEDLANMDLEKFTSTLASVVKGFAERMAKSKREAPAYIALIIQPTQWKAPERSYTDHIADMIKVVKLPIDIRISCPYESQQCNAQMVEWAKENRKVLVLSREIVVWRVA